MQNPIRILLAEDKPGDRELVAEYLARPGIDVELRPAATLEEAKGMLGEEQFDLILLDLDLPDSEGIDTFGALCAKNPDIPVVVITGMDNDASALDAVKKGAQDFLIKGRFDADLLIRSIRYAMERSLLRRQRDRYARIVASSHEAMALVDRGYRYLVANRAYEKLVNRESTAIVGHLVAEVVGEDNFSENLKPKLDLCFTGEEVRFETERDVDGRGPRTVEAIYSPCIEAGGTVTAVAACIRDTSTRRHTENALIESEKRFRILAEATFEAIVIHEAGVLLNANDQFFRMFGYKPSELLGKQIIPLIFAPEAIANIEDRVREGKLGFHESIGMRKDGSTFPIETRVREAEYEERKIRMATIRDVSALKISEQALRRERERLIRYFDITPCLIVALDRDGRIGMLNNQGADLLGCQANEFVGKDWFETFLPEEIRVNTRKTFEGLKQGDTERYAVAEHEILTKSGERRVILWNNAVTRDKSGNVNGTLSAGLDITDRKQIEKALHESEERIRRLAEATFEGIAIHEQGVLLSANNQYFRMFGYEPAELIGKNVVPLTVAPEDREFIETHISAGFLGPYESTGMRKDGSTFPMEVRVRETEHEGRTVRVGAFRDMTEMRDMQASLAQSDRLASMGMLAAGVAHEINNPLAYVLYNLESLARDIPVLTRRIRECGETLRKGLGDAKLDEMLGVLRDVFNPLLFEDLGERFEDTLRGTRRIKEIARGLGTFSRVEQDQPVPVDIRYAAECAINMAYNEIKYRARLVKDFEPVPAIMASEGRLSQVFLNLLVNASHAIEEGDVDNNEIRIRTWEENGNVCASVSDSGTGIPPGNLERIFDPFFSTKDKGVGSGLGLAISRNIVFSYNGRIQVESNEGEGTSFLIRFPALIEDRQAGQRAAESPADLPAAARGKILVVDDERGIRSALKRMLGQDHEVVTAASGEEACSILENDQSFDVILCDMMMPAMSGMELHRWTADRYTELAKRTVFVTGGAFTPRGRAYLAKIDNIRVEKPFNTEEMTGLVRRLVEKAREEDSPA